MTPAPVLERHRVDLPGADGTPAVAPTTPAELADVLAHASRERMAVSVWGGGTHRSIGYRVDPDLIVSTEALTGIEEWQPDDLTVVVGAGTPVSELEDRLEGGGQSAVLPETPGGSTVGGVVATATSAYRRLRYGPTRDRVLEVRVVTGDGRIVKGGGRVVKNVTGYDLPRLFTGSFGSLGVITSICLKLWPLTATTATVTVDDPERVALLYRPLAVLRTREATTVMVGGTREEVDDQLSRLGGSATEGLVYPTLPDAEVRWSLRVRPRLLPDLLQLLPAEAPYIAQPSIGEATFGAPRSWDVAELRTRAETDGGAVVRVGGMSDADPWGTPPPSLPLQRRVVAAFDPAGIMEPGRLPGGL